jgi:anoctamin-10
MTNSISFVIRYALPSRTTWHTTLIRLQFGEAVALYFAFLASYTHNLIFISVIGLLAHYLGHAYSIIYSSLLFLWSVVFVEYWRIRERLISIAWGSLGSVRVENHRSSYIEGHRWWKRELKILVSVPVIVLFVVILTVLLTAIFIFEAFVTTLYTGPGHEYIVSHRFICFHITSHSSFFSHSRQLSFSP